MKVLVFRVMVDLLETVLFILPVHERGRKYKWENIEDLLFTLLVCGFMNAVVIYLMARYTNTEKVVFSNFLSTGILIAKSVILIRFLYGNEGTGLYLSFLSVILMNLFNIAARGTAQWIRVKYFYNITAVERFVSFEYVSIHMTEELLTLGILSVMAYAVGKFLLSLRKLKDSSLGKISVLAMVVMYYEIIVAQSYSFLDYHRYGLFVHRYYSLPTHDVAPFLANLVGFYVVPVIILMLMYQMTETYQAKLQDEEIRSTLRMNKEQLQLIQYTNSSSLHEKHAIAEHLNVIRMFLDKGDQEAARMYIQKTAGVMDEKVRVYCVNPYINAVLNYKIKAEPDITFHVASSIGEVNQIDAVDLGVLLMNLIDCRINIIHRYDLKKDLEINITKREFTIAMAVDSENVKDAEKENPLELSMIENIVEKYNGSIVYGVHDENDMVVMISEKME